jgi:hypothetical protein
MFGFVKNNLIYIKCPRNGCTTYTTFLSANGWNKINLFDTSLNLADYILWGHITNPHHRHTKGIHKYLNDNPDIDINDPTVGKMLISAVFDEHTYSLNMMLSSIWHLPIYWIPLDVSIKKWNQYPVEPEFIDGDELTNDFFKEHNLNLTITKSDHKNVEKDTTIRDKINALKKMHIENYNKLIKNFLEPDIMLYEKVVEKFNKKYL